MNEYNHVFDGYWGKDTNRCQFCSKKIVMGQKCYFEGAGGFYCNEDHWKQYWEFVRNRSGTWIASGGDNKKPRTIEEAIKDPDSGISIGHIDV